MDDDFNYDKYRPVKKPKVDQTELVRVTLELEKISLKRDTLHFSDKGTDFTDVLNIMALNGFTFTAYPSTQIINKSKSPFNSKINKKFPHTYIGRLNGGHYDGCSESLKKSSAATGSKGHQILKKTGLTNIPDSNRIEVYQYEEGTIEEKLDRALQVESMQILATILARALGMKDDKGNQIHSLNQKFNHFDTVFDIEMLEKLFLFKTEHVLVIEKRELEVEEGGVLFDFDVQEFLNY